MSNAIAAITMPLNSAYLDTDPYIIRQPNGSELAYGLGLSIVQGRYAATRGTVLHITTNPARYELQAILRRSKRLPGHSHIGVFGFDLLNDCNGLIAAIQRVTIAPVMTVIDGVTIPTEQPELARFTQTCVYVSETTGTRLVLVP